VALTDESTLAPDAAFDREWATTLLARALARARAECAAEGREAQFDLLKGWLTGEATHGDQAAAARELGLSPGALKSEVHRLRQRFRRHVKAEVADTLRDRSAVEEEMRTLWQALAGKNSASCAQPMGRKTPGME
jgi:RNA polymerase sigma-70 factor (ECF subfamily)